MQKSFVVTDYISIYVRQDVSKYASLQFSQGYACRKKPFPVSLRVVPFFLGLAFVSEEALVCFDVDTFILEIFKFPSVVYSVVYEVMCCLAKK